jgi:hypothetical protein
MTRGGGRPIYEKHTLGLAGGDNSPHPHFVLTWDVSSSFFCVLADFRGGGDFDGLSAICFTVS